MLLLPLSWISNNLKDYLYQCSRTIEKNTAQGSCDKHTSIAVCVSNNGFKVFDLENSFYMINSPVRRGQNVFNNKKHSERNDKIMRVVSA